MNTAKVAEIGELVLKFSDGSRPFSYHDQDCCEVHEINFEELRLDDFDNCEFDLDGDFFERVEDYGIKLLPINNHPIPIAVHSHNSGFYSSHLDLVLERPDKQQKILDVTECQKIYE